MSSSEVGLLGRRAATGTAIGFVLLTRVSVIRSAKWQLLRSPIRQLKCVSHLSRTHSFIGAASELHAIHPLPYLPLDVMLGCPPSLFDMGMWAAAAEEEEECEACEKEFANLQTRSPVANRAAD